MASCFLVAAASLWLVLTFWRSAQYWGCFVPVATSAGAGFKVALSMGGGDSFASPIANTWECNNPITRMGWWNSWTLSWDALRVLSGQFSEAQQRSSRRIPATGALRPEQSRLPVDSRESLAIYETLFCPVRAVMGPITARMTLPNRILSTAWWLAVFPAGFYGLWNTGNCRSRHSPSLSFSRWCHSRHW